LPGFLEDSDLLASLQTVLKPEEGETIPDWIFQAVSDCNAQAWGEIIEAMAERGYTPQQILSWYSGPSRQRSIGLRLLGDRLSLLTSLTTQEKGTPEQRRLDLLRVTVTDANGVLILPEPVAGQRFVAPVTGGRMQVDCDEVFRVRCGPVYPPGTIPPILPPGRCGWRRRHEWRPW
jgi:hypothetical protein